MKLIQVTLAKGREATFSPSQIVAVMRMPSNGNAVIAIEGGSGLDEVAMPYDEFCGLWLKAGGYDGYEGKGGVMIEAHCKDCRHYLHQTSLAGKCELHDKPVKRMDTTCNGLEALK